MGGLYSKLFHLKLSEHLPYVTLGLIIWGLISASILEGAEVFVANEGSDQAAAHPAVRARLSNGVAPGAAVRTQHRDLRDHRDDLSEAMVVGRPVGDPGAGADMLNCIWASLVFGIVGTRFRDIAPLLNSVVQLLFFMTPIIWNAQTLAQQGASRWGKIVELNPLLHYLDIVRAPLLGAPQELRHWIVVIVLTVIGWILAAFAMRQYRSRVPYWV